MPLSGQPSCDSPSTTQKNLNSSTPTNPEPCAVMGSRCVQSKALAPLDQFSGKFLRICTEQSQAFEKPQAFQDEVFP